jgi:exopolysaccharide/PEP-CTERM locus tyrosine autokinase
MSIIERALQRHQEAQRQQAAAPAGTTPVPPAAAPRHSTTLPTNAPAIPVANVLSRENAKRPVLNLDADSLESVGLFAPTDRRRRHTHEHRVIKRNLIDLKTVSGTSRLVMVTSALAGEGKTFTSFHLARSLAMELDRQVILVDADIPKRDMSRLLGCDSQPGLLDLLRDTSLSVQSLLIPTSIPQLWFLPVGRADEMATELLASDRMRQVARELAEADARCTVVFDSAPLLLTSEAQSLAQVVDKQVLVVRAGVTSQDAVLETVRRLGSGKPIGVVLNGWEPGGLLGKQYQAGGYYEDTFPQKAK